MRDKPVRPFSLQVADVCGCWIGSARLHLSAALGWLLKCLLARQVFACVVLKIHFPPSHKGVMSSGTHERILE